MPSIDCAVIAVSCRACAVVLVGENPASEVYVRNKSKAVTEAGMQAFDRKLPATTSEADLINLIAVLNSDEQVNGVLVQLRRCQSKSMHTKLSQPSIRPRTLMVSIRTMSDVSPAVFPLLFRARRWAACAWPRPCIHSLAGLEAVVIGRSNIVGKPMAQLLLAENATVTIAHSKTVDLATVCRRADLLVAAIGKPQLVRGDWIKPGATVIDVGINRVPGDGGKSRIVGDVNFVEASKTAGARLRRFRAASVR